MQSLLVQSFLQPLVDQFHALLQPLYDALEQLRFFAALIMNAIAALCFAQTLDDRATFVSRSVYLLVLWFLLPTALSLADSFYHLLGFSSRENFTAWLWLVKPSVFSLFACAYITAGFFAVRKKHVLDFLLFFAATGLMLHRLYGHFTA